MRLLLVASALLFGAFWYTMPAPRTTLVECSPARANDVKGARLQAAAIAGRLRDDRRLIYGWPIRARLHLENLGFWFGERVLGYYGGEPSRAYLAGEAAAIPELTLIWTLRDALQVPDCVAAVLVPDSATDSRQQAEEKIRRILVVLGHPAALQAGAEVP